MKQLTKKERGKIYRKSAERVDNSYNSSFCCDNLNALYPVKYIDMDKVFIEFFLFEPEIYEDNVGWWIYGDRNVRVIALLLAYQMTK